MGQFISLISYLRTLSKERMPTAENKGTERHYRPESIDELENSTAFSRHELKMLYRGFKEACPAGYVTKVMFMDIFEDFFCIGSDPDVYSEMVFNTFDDDNSQTITFTEFVEALSVLLRGTTTEKLSWVFNLYDQNQKGYIEKADILNVLIGMYAVIGDNAYPPIRAEDILRHVDDIFTKLDRNRDGQISEEEFVANSLTDQNIITSFDELYTVW